MDSNEDSALECARSAPAIRAERAAQRQLLLDRLRDDGDDDLARRLAKCGLPLRLVCTSCGTTRLSATRCDLKWCPSCQYGLATAAAERFARIATVAKWPLRVTFTARNFGYDEAWPRREVRRDGQTSTVPVSPIRWIRTVAWSERLRRQTWWRARVTGGVLGFEVTDTGRGYHVHAHSLLDCRWLAVTEKEPGRGAGKAVWAARGKAAATEVGDQWRLCCQRDASVQVRRVWTRDGDIRQAIIETVKYSTKGSDLVGSVRPPGALIRLLDGCRMVSSFGSFFGRAECKRIHSAGCACGECGAVGTILPEDIAIGSALNEHGLRSRRR